MLKKLKLRLAKNKTYKGSVGIGFRWLGGNNTRDRSHFARTTQPPSKTSTKPRTQPTTITLKAKTRKQFYRLGLIVSFLNIISFAPVAYGSSNLDNVRVDLSKIVREHPGGKNLNEYINVGKVPITASATTSSRRFVVPAQNWQNETLTIYDTLNTATPLDGNGYSCSLDNLGTIECTTKYGYDLKLVPNNVLIRATMHGKFESGTMNKTAIVSNGETSYYFDKYFSQNTAFNHSFNLSKTMTLEQLINLQQISPPSWLNYNKMTLNPGVSGLKDPPCEGLGIGIVTGYTNVSYPTPYCHIQVDIDMTMSGSYTVYMKLNKQLPSDGLHLMIPWLTLTTYNTLGTDYGTDSELKSNLDFTFVTKVNSFKVSTSTIPSATLYQSQLTGGGSAIPVGKFNVIVTPIIVQTPSVYFKISLAHDSSVSSDSIVYACNPNYPCNKENSYNYGWGLYYEGQPITSNPLTIDLTFAKGMGGTPKKIPITMKFTNSGLKRNIADHAGDVHGSANLSIEIQ